MTTNGYRALFGGDINILKLHYSDDQTTLVICTKRHCIVHLK